MKEQNEYTKQAEDFLSRNNLKMRITLSDSKPANWEPSGHHYRVTINGKHEESPSLPDGTHLNRLGRRITFDFWGSVADMEAGNDPTPYDVLACISGDVHCPETFKDFCREYGYESDSIKAMQTWKRCDRFAKRLREFLTSEEIEQLQEIR